MSLTSEEITQYHEQIPAWNMLENKNISKEFTFPDFKAALEFVNKVGDIAESKNHHPDIVLGWGKVKVELSTHSAGGLTEKDFVMALQIDQLS